MSPIGILRSRINRVPSGKVLSDGMNASEVDIFLVLYSKISILSDSMVFSLTKSEILNRSC